MIGNLIKAFSKENFFLIEMLLKQRREYFRRPEEKRDEDYEKTNEDAQFFGGCTISIKWKDRKHKDYGYCFLFPGISNADESDVFYHIPMPNNEEGMDNVSEVFGHIGMLLANPLALEVKILRK